MDLTNYFSIDQILNELIGSTILLVILGIALILFIGIKSNLHTSALIMLCALFISVMMTYAFLGAFWTIIVLIAGLFFYLALTKWIRRG